MTHNGCQFLMDPWKRAMIFKDTTVQCQGCGVMEHPATGRPVNTQCVLLNGHAGPCDGRPVGPENDHPSCRANYGPRLEPEADA
jgi:hypothetical protein